MILGLMVVAVLYILKSKNFHVSLFIMKWGYEIKSKAEVADL